MPPAVGGTGERGDVNHADGSGGPSHLCVVYDPHNPRLVHVSCATHDPSAPR